MSSYADAQMALSANTNLLLQGAPVLAGAALRTSFYAANSLHALSGGQLVLSALDYASMAGANSLSLATAGPGMLTADTDLSLRGGSTARLTGGASLFANAPSFYATARDTLSLSSAVNLQLTGPRTPLRPNSL